MLIISFEGILVNFISYPVINAFTSAAAITIGFGQVKVKEHTQRLFNHSLSCMNYFDTFLAIADCIIRLYNFNILGIRVPRNIL